MAGSRRVLTRRNGKLLYAVVLEKCVQNWRGAWTWVPHPKRFVYVHAKDVEEARALYNKAPEPGICRIVGIAPVIGFNVHDNHGDKLSV